jgi:hypothetical protein
VKVASADTALRIGELAAVLDGGDEALAKDAARELVRLVLEMHGAGLARIVQMLSGAGAAGAALVAAMTVDPATRSLLLLYGLHPDPLEQRARRAVDTLRAELGVHDLAIELVQATEALVTLRLRARSGRHRPAAAELRRQIEGVLFEHVPETARVEIDGLLAADAAEIRFMPRPDASPPRAAAAGGALP